MIQYTTVQEVEDEKRKSSEFKRQLHLSTMLTALQIKIQVKKGFFQQYLGEHFTK